VGKGRRAYVAPWIITPCGKKKVRTFTARSAGQHNLFRALSLIATQPKKTEKQRNAAWECEDRGEQNLTGGTKVRIGGTKGPKRAQKDIWRWICSCLACWPTCPCLREPVERCISKTSAPKVAPCTKDLSPSESSGCNLHSTILLRKIFRICRTC
jgi:hypothetical protein